MATYESAESVFSTQQTGPVPRWQRKAMEAKGGDRFISDRSNMNMDACKFNLNSYGDSNAACSPSKAEFQRTMKANLMSEGDSKILALKQQAPKPKAGYQSDLNVLFSGNKENSARTVKSSTRHIPQAPDRILDAPELRPDFYLNLIEWSSQNIISVALGQQVYLWDATSGDINQLPFELSDPTDYVSSVSWVQDGKFLAVGTAESKCQIWDVQAQKKVRTLRCGPGRIAASAWNQHTLSTGSRGGDILNHDVRIQQHVTQTLQGHTQEVCGLKWDADGKYLASGGNDNIVNVWNARGAQHCNPITAHTAAVKALAWCPWQSNLLATGGGTADRSIVFSNVNTGATVNRIDTKSQVSSLVWNREHKQIISGHGYAENQLSIWNYPTMNKVTDLNGHTERILNMSASPDGQTIVSAAADETLRFWRCFAHDEKAKKKVRQGGATRSRLVPSLR